ncbi:hypothetical protein DOTSEDRAFT_32423 [Dothistroma septosporum NZE10]|uniref:Uncharacterized protein n=1 Tax=Dothistroma septosporum (strain NZE10 / CBS 128990) TaxID=675120 RepID=N1Q0F3_DOTSN|nr:hypothetical protein DOTSEDRAFT_32423 [Dothistroma septosporum NZE10]
MCRERPIWNARSSLQRPRRYSELRRCSWTTTREHRSTSHLATATNIPIPNYCRDLPAMKMLPEPRSITTESKRLAERVVVSVSKVVSTIAICKPVVVSDGAKCPVQCTPVPMSVPVDSVRDTLSWNGWSSCHPRTIPAATATQVKVGPSITVTLPSSAAVSTTTFPPTIASEMPVIQGPGPVIPTQSSTTTSESSMPDTGNLAQSTSSTDPPNSTTTTLTSSTTSSIMSNAATQHNKSFSQTGAGIATITVLALLVLAIILAIVFWRRMRRGHGRVITPLPKDDGQSIELEHRIPPDLHTLPATLPEAYIQAMQEDSERRRRLEEHQREMGYRLVRMKAENRESSRASKIFGRQADVRAIKD